MSNHDVIVIGAGPGGYVAAIRAAQLGFNVACIEKEPALGGTCLRVGCIPSKALLESSEKYVEARAHLAEHGVKVADVALDLAAMLRRKDEIVRGLTGGVDGLFKKNKVTRYAGHGRIVAPGRVEVLAEAEPRRTELTAAHIIIATGSKVASLRGVTIDGVLVGDSTTALGYDSPPEKLVVIGAGYIGLELGSVWQRLGSQVTVLEYLDRILPGMDAELAGEALRIFKKQGIDFRLGCRVTGVHTRSAAETTSAARADAAGGKAARNGGKGGEKAAGGVATRAPRSAAAQPACRVEIDGQEPIECDRVLVAVGRAPNTDNLGLESVGIQLDERGRIPVNAHFATSAAGVYAIGDVIRGPMLAHKAEEEGVAVAEFLKTGHCHVNYDAIPGVVYTNPEVATVGKTEEELKAADRAYRRGVFHFRGNGRARALAQVDGRVKILADAKTDRILGVHIIGPRAGDLIAEAAVAIEFGASAEDLARSSHAHPTLAEALKEAALAVDGRAIHA